MNWRGALFAALLVLAAASGWSVWKQRTAAPAAAAPSERSDYVLEDFQLVALDDDGREAFTLRAPWLRRNPADDTLSLRDPLFLLPEDEGDFYWDLRAATGWISADSERMRLEGDVVAVSDPAGGREMRLETTALEVLPRQRRAHTDAAVTVTQPGTTMRGTGMEADLAGKRFQLTSKVHTRYVPSRR